MLTSVAMGLTMVAVLGALTCRHFHRYYSLAIWLVRIVYFSGLLAAPTIIIPLTFSCLFAKSTMSTVAQLARHLIAITLYLTLILFVGCILTNTDQYVMSLSSETTMSAALQAAEIMQLQTSRALTIDGAPRQASAGVMRAVFCNSNKVLDELYSVNTIRRVERAMMLSDSGKTWDYAQWRILELCVANTTNSNMDRVTDLEPARSLLLIKQNAYDALARWSFGRARVISEMFKRGEDVFSTQSLLQGGRDVQKASWAEFEKGSGAESLIISCYVAIRQHIVSSMWPLLWVVAYLSAQPHHDQLRASLLRFLDTRHVLAFLEQYVEARPSADAKLCHLVDAWSLIDSAAAANLMVQEGLQRQLRDCQKQHEGHCLPGETALVVLETWSAGLDAMQQCKKAWLSAGAPVGPWDTMAQTWWSKEIVQSGRIRGI